MIDCLDIDIFKDRRSVRDKIRIEWQQRKTITRKSHLELANGQRFLIGVMHDVTNVTVANRALKQSKEQLELKSSELEIRADTLARIGGEEFAVVVPGAEETRVRAAAEKVCAAIRSEPVVHNSRIIPTTVSIGVVCRLGDEPYTLEEGFKLADQRHCDAKRSGRDRYAMAA